MLGVLALGLLGSIALPESIADPTVTVPAGINHSPWDTLLKKYVDDRGLVNYGAWQADEADMQALVDYLAKFAPKPTQDATGPEEIASLINVYNAITVRWILQNYPTESIRELDDSWEENRWTVGGRSISLDELEHQNLRPLYGWRVHATIVCAARSCPPLQPSAFTTDTLAALTEQAYRAWLSRDDLNRYDPQQNEVEISSIFKWFQKDFVADGNVKVLLAEWGPKNEQSFLKTSDYDIDYMDYHWGLNDQGASGRDYQASIWSFLF